jgi:hypothetical protein
VKRLALLAALASGCGAVQDHPFTATALTNSAITTTAGVCTFECRGAAQDVSEGALIGELALSSVLAGWVVLWVAENRQ